LILRKIITIVATRCQILRLKCTKFDFAGFKGPTSKGREGGREGERKGRGKGGKREGEGKGGKRREKGGTPPLQSTPPVKKSWIRACTEPIKVHYHVKLCLLGIPPGPVWQAEDGPDTIPPA